MDFFKKSPQKTENNRKKTENNRKQKGKKKLFCFLFECNLIFGALFSKKRKKSEKIETCSHHIKYNKTY